MTLDRFSDGSIAYVEMDVAVHKTMFASARRFRYLNLAHLVWGFMAQIGYLNG